MRAWKRVPDAELDQYPEPEWVHRVEPSGTFVARRPQPGGVASDLARGAGVPPTITEPGCEDCPKAKRPRKARKKAAKKRKAKA